MKIRVLFFASEKKLKVGVQWYVGKYTSTYKEIHNLWDMLKCLKISDMDVGLRFSEVYIYIQCTTTLKIDRFKKGTHSEFVYINSWLENYVSRFKMGRYAFR